MTVDADATPVDLGALRAEDFAPHLGATFEVRAGAAPVPLELVDVHELDPTAGGAVVGFVLSFAGPLDHPLAQGIHGLRHPTLGELPLFVVPVQDLDVTSRSYEVVFQQVRT